MTTCSRCGKDNQRHYKFCLGCGAKLEAPKPAEPAPRVTSDSSALPLPTSTSSSAPAAASRPTGTGAAAMPSATEPLRPSGPSGPSGPGRPSAPLATAAASAPSAALETEPAAEPELQAEPVAATTAAPADLVACSQCGKMVVATYAFCGSCGRRLSSPRMSAAASMGTMQLGSSLVVQAAPRGHLTLIRPDGTEGGVHPLLDGENLIGRGQGSLFDADPYLSPRHAEISFTNEGMVLRDLRSLNGVFIKIMQEEELETGDIFRIGQELLRFDFIAPPAALENGTEIIGTPNPGFWGRLSVIVGRDLEGPAFPLFEENITLGRERGDIQFPEDGYVSGSHAQLSLRTGRVFLSDRGSSNGTFLRIRGGRVVPSGSLLLMGQQLFRASFR